MAKRTNEEIQPQVDILCNDTPTKYAHLGWRFVCALLSWFLLGKSITAGSAFFASISLFVAPLMLDYFKYEPLDRVRGVISLVAKFVNGFFLICAALGLFGIVFITDQNGILIVKTSNSFIYPDMHVIDVQNFWWMLFSTVAICAVDWAANRTTLEQDIAENKKKGSV